MEWISLDDTAPLPGAVSIDMPWAESAMDRVAPDREAARVTDGDHGPSEGERPGGRSPAYFARTAIKSAKTTPARTAMVCFQRSLLRVDWNAII